MKKNILLLTVILMASCQSFNPIEKLEHYNVKWDSPSTDHTGSMPLGNGDISLNAWMESNGDLLFYIGKTDAWSDNARLLKLGKVRICLSPTPDLTGFNQTLELASGSVLFQFGKPGNQTELRLWADANHPVIRIEAKSDHPLTLTAHSELWRTQPDTLPTLEASDVLLDRNQPDQKRAELIVSPDELLTGIPDAIGWYHHNTRSVGPDMAQKIQGLSGFRMEDPLLNRIFGVLISGQEVEKLDETSVQSAQKNDPSLTLAVHTSHPSSPEQWISEVTDILNDYSQKNDQLHWQEHRSWWTQFWNRSWLFADGDEEASVITRGYVLQRFITACAGRGQYPIKFNGSVFTVPYEGAPGDADYRLWGPGYWWQNTRLPYLSLCTSGDFDMMKPLFDMYTGEVFELAKYRVNKYFGIEGAFIPECIYFWGSVFSVVYGWQPMEEREDPLQVSGYHKWEWVSGPELAWMMLDYYDHTLDEDFLQDTVIPFSMEIMKFFDQFYSCNEQGQLVMHPSQAVETWWECTNPMPELAGLIAVSDRLLALPEGILEGNESQWIKEFSAKLPDLPLREINNELLALAPAEKYADKRNIENPELYAVFPFRLVSFEQYNADWGMNAFNHRWDKGNFGWRQEEIFQAYLGLTEGCKENLAGRASNSDANSRFPAFWGPNYDWVPDQDHGGVLMKGFQSMLIQTSGDKILLTPAWPEEWSGEFKVHAPFNTTIQGRIENGEIVQYTVVPRSRKGDVTVY